MLRFTLLTIVLGYLAGCHHVVQSHHDQVTEPEQAAHYEGSVAEHAIANSDMADFAHRY